MASTADGEVMLQLLQEFRDFRLETRGSFQGLDRRMDALEGRMDGLDRRISTLEALFESLDQRMGSLELLFGSLDQRVGSLEVMVTNLHVTNKRIVGYIKRVGRMLVQVATDRDELDARMDHLERRLILLEM